MPNPLKPIIPKAGDPSLQAQDDPDEAVLERALLRRKTKDPAQTEPPAPETEKYQFPDKVALPPSAVLKDKKALYESIEALPICDIEGGLPITDQYLANVHRVFYTPASLIKPDEQTGERYDWAHFVTPEDLKNLEQSQSEIRAAFFNPNSDELLQRILISQNNFPYNVELSVLGGMIKTKFPGHYEVCRSKAKEADGGHRLYVHGGNRVLSNTCEDKNIAFLRPLPTIRLEPQEVLQLVNLGRLSTAEYCIADDWSGKFFITPNLTTVDLLKEKIAKSGLFKPERKKAILEDMETAVALDKNQEKDRKSVMRLNIGQIVLGVVGTAFTVLLYKLFRDMHKEKIDATKFLEDHTERAKAHQYSRLWGEEADLEEMTRTTLKPEKRHIIISGPAGSGKTETVKGFLHRVAIGEVSHLQGYRIFRFNTPKFGEAAAKYVGQLEKAFAALLEKVSDRPSIVYIPEAQVLSGFGATEGRRVDVRDYLKPYMEGDSGVIFIFDTNKPEALLDDDAIARRVTPITKEAPNFSKALAVLEQRYQTFTNGFKIQDAAKAVIVHLAGSLPGGKIDGALDLLQDLIADAKLKKKTEHIFTSEDVIEFFAKKYKMDPKAVELFVELSCSCWHVEELPQILNDLRKSRASEKEVLSVLKQLMHGDTEKRLKGDKGPKGGGTPPPAAPAGGGGGAEGAGPASEGGPEGKASGESDGKVNRVAVEMERGDSSPRQTARLRMTEIPARRMTEAPRYRGLLEISQGVTGFGKTVAPFLLLDVAENRHWIASWLKSTIIGGVMVAQTYLDRMTPGVLAVLYGPFEFSGKLAEVGLNTFDIHEDNPWYKPIRTTASFAGAEASIIAIGKGAGAKTFVEAHGVGREVIHNALLNVPENVRESLRGAKETTTSVLQNFATGLRMYWKEASAVASGYLATAKVGVTALGESLVTGGLMFAEVASCLVTPIFMINGLDTWGNKIPDDAI